MATTPKSAQQPVDKTAVEKARAAEAEAAARAEAEKQATAKALAELAEAAQIQKSEEDAAAAAAGEAAAAKAAELKPGQKAFVSAVHGKMVHPLTAQEFDSGSAVRTEVDNWVLVQLKAGKLTIED